MLFTPSDLGFNLNNREIAVLTYICIFLTAVLLWKRGRPDVFGIVRSFLAPTLLHIWLIMSLYVVACVLLLAWSSLWGWPNLKSTLLWWLTVGFTCLFEAQRLQNKPDTLRKLVREAFTLSVIILFIAELESFPLWVELLILPSLILLTLLIAFSEHRANNPGFAQVLKLLRGLQLLAGLLILSFSYWQVVGKITEHLSLNTLREFGLPLLLWLMFVPFIFLLAVYMTYENAFISLAVDRKNGSIVRYARWRTLCSFGWNMEGVRRLTRDIRMRHITDMHGVEDAIQEVKRRLEIEKNPPTVTFDAGWSPHQARRFLEEFGLITGDYHRTQWEWFAHVASVKLKDAAFADRISYYLTGNEHAVTRLRIALDGSNLNDRHEAKRAFDQRALTLLAKALGADQAEMIYGHEVLETKDYLIEGTRVSLEKSSWGDARFGDYGWNLTIVHNKHQSDV